MPAVIDERTNILADESPDTIRARINSTISEAASAKEELVALAKSLRTAEKKYNKLSEKAAYDAPARLKSKLSQAEKRLAECVAEFVKVEARAIRAINLTEKLYSRLAEHYDSVANRSEAKKCRRSAKKFLANENKALDKICDPVAAVVASFTAKNSRLAQSSAQKPSEAPVLMQEQCGYFPTARQSVTVAPVTIDVGAMVELAVKETMKKFNEALSEQLAAYTPEVLPQLNVESTEVQAQTVAPSNIATEAVNEEPPVVTEPSVTAAEEIVENTVADPLDELTVNPAISARLDSILAELDAMIAAITPISEKAKEITDAQRALSDAQRSAVRETQGTQVKQKLLKQEQEKLAEEQSSLAVAQKELADKQTAIIETQKAQISMLNGIIETQTQLEAALKSAMQSQKALIQTNAKNAEQLSKQIELAMQNKQAIAAIKPARQRKQPSDVSADTDKPE